MQEGLQALGPKDQLSPGLYRVLGAPGRGREGGSDIESEPCLGLEIFSAQHLLERTALEDALILPLLWYELTQYRSKKEKNFTFDLNPKWTRISFPSH